VEPGIIAGGIGAILTVIFTIITIGLSVLCPLVMTAGTLFFVYRLVSGMKKGQQVRNELLTTGVPAQANIEQVSMGGMVTTIGVRRSLQMTLVLTVQRAGEAPYRVSMTTMVPEMAMAALQPGSTVPVRVDAQDPNRLAIDLPAMGYMDAGKYL